MKVVRDKAKRLRWGGGGRENGKHDVSERLNANYHSDSACNSTLPPECYKNNLP